MSCLNAKTRKALVSQIAYHWAFLFQAGDRRHRGQWLSVHGGMPLQGLLAMSGEVFGTGISVAKGRDAAKHLKNSQAGPTQQRINGIKCPQCWVWETAPRQWLSQCGPQINSIFTNWGLDRNANSPRHLCGSTESQTLRGVWQTVGAEGVKEVKLSLLF